MIFFGFLLVSLFFSFVLQQFIPPLPWGWLEGSRLMLVPLVFFYGALALPLWGMLVMAFAAGFMWDAFHAQVLDGELEFFLGWSILLYGALGAIMSGFRPLFRRGRWEIHCLMSGLFTSLMVFVEYLLIALKRGVFFPPQIWGRIAGAGLAAALVGPLVFLFLDSVADVLRFKKAAPEVEP